MIAINKPNNADAVVFKLLRSLCISTDQKSVSSELIKHPEYPSLLSVSDILKSFKIDNNAFRVAYDDLINLQCPFLAHTILDGESLVIINGFENGRVIYSNEKVNRRSMSSEDFKRQYNGVVIFPDSKEIDFSRSRAVSAFIESVKSKIFFTASIALLLLIVYYQTNFFKDLNLQLSCLALLKIFGLAASIMLLIQSIDSNNELVKMICKANSKSDCNAILSSKAAKVFGIEWLNWSDIGFFYFAGTSLLILTGTRSQSMLSLLFILNLASLPYTFYSIYYQSRVAKQWCVLCCTVQAVLWLEFITIISGGLFSHGLLLNDFQFAWSKIVICLIFPVLLWTAIKPLLSQAHQASQLKLQLRKFKYNTSLFDKMLKSQPKYQQPDEDWSIVLGNRSAGNILTVISDPYCPPCSRAHQLLHRLLEENRNLQARIIFTPDHTTNDSAIAIRKHLIALKKMPEVKIKDALNDWYEQKQKNYADWAKANPVDLQDIGVEQLEMQKYWCQTAQITMTPTILINGYLLPEQYELSDLKYMLE